MNEDKVVIGIVGKIGCGKSTVSKILTDEYRFQSIDVDKIGHLALEAMKDDVAKAFGKQTMFPDGNVDRTTLGNLVFSDPEQLAVLNSIVHPWMKDEVTRLIAEGKASRYAIDAALLFEIGLDELCDYIVSVDAPDAFIIERVKQYRHWDESKIRKVLESQKYLEFLKDRSHFILFNNNGLSKLKKQIEFFILEIF